ncbi:MAG: Trehalose-6-phosphate phosphatase [uncultured Gemmatimonadaceae bacterium]|uniref:Trehalose 6-phosphate phosphatase n=1 Tax=uncultured Gemmatimonadaceae bacterium TaxID=246130 RepID=A0A6J4MG89_9BACT|nr:MAG: Trehalose-6-phosphate phosphatase [uncultured Gemmatimonadaceae bacterium]
MTGPRTPGDAAAILPRLAGTPLVLLLDVDGTLAPIAERPEDAVVPSETRQVIAGLARLPGVRVALVSGRAAADALRMVALSGLAAAGNHGFELVGGDGESRVHPAAAPYLSAVRAAAADLREELASVEGAQVEDKGPTVSVHFRRVDPAHAGAVRDAARRAGVRHGLRTGDGKLVVELRPPVEVHKGTAVLTLADELGGGAPSASLLFAGDDVTDEDAFHALRGAHPRAVTVHVGASPHTAAEFAVPDAPALRAVLAAVLAARSDETLQDG